MTDPFEVTESTKAQGTYKKSHQITGMVDQLMTSEDHPIIEEIGIKGIRGVVAEVVCQRSDLEIQLEDLQKKTLREQREFYLKLLNIGDSHDRLLRMLDSSNEAVETINAVRTQFLQALDSVGISPIELRVGDIFDLNTCEASSHQERADLAPSTIITVEDRGYMWGKKVLRPARVIIATNSKGD